MEGSKVRIIHAGYERTVPACRVIPYENSVEVVEVAINENVSDVLYDSSDDDSFTDPTINIVTELRPKFYKNISFMVHGENLWKHGKVDR